MSSEREVRRAARGLVVAAIARYRSTLEASERIELRAADPEAPGVREEWAALEGVAENAWDMAEVALAEAIEQLYDVLAPPGRRVREDTSPYFVTRAVAHRGWVYVLTGKSDDFDSHYRVIAMIRARMVIGLARRRPRR